MITEIIIESAITRLSESREEIEARFVNNHHVFFDYLHNEIFSALVGELQTQLYFCINVIHESCFLSNGSLPHFSMEDYVENEDHNWIISETHSNWQNTVDAFFKEYPEEDLLAFVEDMLSEIKEYENSSVSIEVMFIIAKSYIDTICDI